MKDNNGLEGFIDHTPRSTYHIPRGEERELANKDVSLSSILKGLGRGKRQSSADGDDGEDDQKISRMAFVDMPLQFRLDDETLTFSPNSKMGSNSTVILSPQWTGTLSSYTDIRGENSGYTQAAVELDYDIPPASTKQISPSVEKASLNFGLQARGYHQFHFGGNAVVRSSTRKETTFLQWLSLPRFLNNIDGFSSSSRNDLTLSANYSQWLNRPTEYAPDDSSGQATITASQQYGLCTVQSTCTIPNTVFSSSSPSSMPTLDMSVSSLKSYHPWNIRMGWRWHHRRNACTVRPFCNISVTPKLSEILSLHFNAGWTLSRGLTTTCLWKQSLGGSMLATLSQSDASVGKNSTKGEREEKSLQLGVQTNWMARRTAALFVWTDNEFRLRVPISIVPSSSSASRDSMGVSGWIAFSLQSIFLTLLTRVIQDGLADIFQLHMVQKKTKETSQQQIQLQRQKDQNDAMKQQNLMKRQAQIRTGDEGETGLIIWKAFYGLNPETHIVSADNSRPAKKPGGKNAEEKNDSLDDSVTNSTLSTTSPSTSTVSSLNDDILDVTVPLQFWVQNGQLELPAISKRNMLGFYDPRSTKKDDEEPFGPTNNSGDPMTSSAQQQRSWWKGFVSPTLRTLESKTQGSNSPLELCIVYSYGGFTYEINIRDEDGLVLPSPHAVRTGKQPSPSEEESKE